MEQIEVISWKILDALKSAATNVVEIIGDLETNEQMAVFCSIEEDFIELYYSEVDSSYIRHFEDEDEFYKYIEISRKELGDENYEAVNYFSEDEFSEESSSDDYDYNVKDEDDDDF
jgi:hypothetical protein